MRLGHAPGHWRGVPLRPYLAVSLALHAVLGGALYWAGAYQVEQRRQDAQVVGSVQATYHARTVRRLEDLQKIKEFMEQSARSAPEPDAPAAAPSPVPDDPREQLAQARALSTAIDDISRELKAEERARLTGMSKEQARAEVDAEMAPTRPAPAHSADPADEIARLEAQARIVLGQRADDLQRKQEGIAVSAGEHAARIEDFLGQGVDPARAPRRRSTVGRLVNYGNGQIPHVGTGHAIKGQGRMLGPGGQYAERIYLNSWYLIGPFAGRRESGTAGTPVHPPEQAVLLDAVYRGKERRLLRWEYLSNMAYPLIPREPVEDAVYYGYTEVLMDHERDLMVWIGVDDDATVYLNDRMMWQSDDSNKGWFFDSVYRNRQGYDRDFNRTERRMLVRFKKGRNKIFVKLWNDTNEMFFSMVLTLPAQASTR